MTSGKKRKPVPLFKRNRVRAEIALAMQSLHEHPATLTVMIVSLTGINRLINISRMSRNPKDVEASGKIEFWIGAVFAMPSYMSLASFMVVRTSMYSCCPWISLLKSISIPAIWPSA